MHMPKKAIAIPVAVGLVVAGGIAYAAWTSSGSGTAAARSTTSLNSVIAPGDNAADLYPGATMTVTVSITNPNSYPIVINSISGGSSDLVNTTCAAGTVTSDARPTDATGLVQSDTTTKTIAPNGTGIYTLTTHMATSATDACKSQTFSLPLTAALSSIA
jgi:hypothetical protein